MDQNSPGTGINKNNRPQRNRKKPQRYKGNKVRLPSSLNHSLPDANQASSMVHPVSNFVSYGKLSNDYKAFLMAISAYDEPKHFSQVVKHSEWCEAMQ